MSPRPDARSTKAQEWRAWYWTSRWRAIAKHQLTIEPLCRMCTSQGRATPATVCDHVARHNGDPVIFWHGPFQSLCATHHDVTKQREEKRGFVVGSDIHGRPTDPSHPWNRK